MSDRLPEYIDPLELAAKRGALRGRLALSLMKRLRGMLVDDQGYAELELAFGKEGRVDAVRGHVEATLHLRCQNCLGMINWQVRSEVSLAIVTSLDEVDLLPETYEPLLQGEERTALKDIVEEELLLAIPMIPKHADNCRGQGTSLPCVDEPVGKHNENPFSLLAQSKYTGDK